MGHLHQRKQMRRRVINSLSKTRIKSKVENSFIDFTVMSKLFFQADIPNITWNGVRLTFFLIPAKL